VTTRLGEVLVHSDRWSASDKLYMSFGKTWTEQSECLVLPMSDTDALPASARDAGLEYALGMDAIQDVVANARDQLGTVTSRQLLEAFTYYYDNDAFLDFSQREPGGRTTEDAAKP
jgi:hypothetical protein